MHERACPDKDDDEGGGDPERPVEVRLIVKDLVKGRSEEDGGAYPCEDGVFFDIEIVPGCVRGYLA